MNKTENFKLNYKTDKYTGFWLGDLIKWMETYHCEVNTCYGGMNKDYFKGVLDFYFAMWMDKDHWDNFIEDAVKNKSEFYLKGVSYGIVWTQFANVDEEIRRKFAPIADTARKKLNMTD